MVIAIIGLLASIVVVNVNSARDKARVAKAVSFSQQIYRALGSEAMGAWDFNDNVNDISGNGNNGTLMGGPAYVPSLVFSGGNFGKALSFNGANNYVSTPITSAAYTSATQEAWIKANAGNWYGRIVTKGGGRWTVQKSTSNTIKFELSTAGGSVGNNVTASFQDGAWTHIVTVYDGSQAKLYINGELKSSYGGVSGAIDDVGDALSIGADSGSAYPFNGLIDEVRIYSKALSFAEIQKHYAKGLEKHQLAKQ